MEQHNPDRKQQCTSKTDDEQGLKIFAYSSYAAGILLLVLTLIFDQTQAGVPVLKLFNYVLDVRMLCAVLWLLGSAGLYEVCKLKKGIGLAAVMASTYFAMIQCSVLSARAFTLILYLVMGILIICASREGYAISKIIHKLLILLYVAIPLAILFADMGESPFIYRNFALVFDPRIDPVGGGYLYYTITQLLKGASWFAESSYIGQSGLALNQLISASAHNYILIRIIAGYGLFAGIAILAALSLLSAVLCKMAVKVENGISRGIALGCSLFFTVQAGVAAIANFALLPVLLSCHMPLTGSLMDVFCGFLLIGMVLWLRGKSILKQRR